MLLFAIHSKEVGKEVGNSPGKALQDGVSIVVIRPPVPDISGWTDRHTEYEYYYIRLDVTRSRTGRSFIL